MSCRGVRRRLSAYLDQDLPPGESRAVAEHLRRCDACSAHWDSLRRATELLSESPRLEPSERIAARVLDRLEIERRGPGLALLFRPTWSHAPVLVASLVPGTLVLASVLAAALALGHDAVTPESIATEQAWLPPSGTEANPLFTSSEVSPPQVLMRASLEHLEGLGEEALFLETVVARDGSVSEVTLLEGDSEDAAPFLDALRTERFEPGRFQGRPVAVSVYRLISWMVVRAS